MVVVGQQRVLNQRVPLLERGRDPSARNPSVFLKNPHVFIYFWGFRSRKDAKSGPAGFILPVRPKNSPQEKVELPATPRKPGVFQKKKKKDASGVNRDRPLYLSSRNAG